MRTLTAFLLVSTLLLLAGCDPCKSKCREMTAIYDECLTEWDLRWEDLNATGRIDYRDRCFADHDQRRGASGAPSDFNAACGDDLDRLRAPSTCEEHADQFASGDE